MQGKLDKGGLLPLKAIPMGGKSVFLTAAVTVDINAILQEEGDFFRSGSWKFDNGILSIYLRRDSYGVKIQGVSVHAWKEVCFTNLVQLVGSFIKMEPRQRKVDLMWQEY